MCQSVGASKTSMFLFWLVSLPSYGRFSKSIRPDECGMSYVQSGYAVNWPLRRAVCGACKVGKLIPLFTQAAPRTPKTKAGSRMAPEKTQGVSFASTCHPLLLIFSQGHRVLLLHLIPWNVAKGRSSRTEHLGWARKCIPPRPLIQTLTWKFWQHHSVRPRSEEYI